MRPEENRADENRATAAQIGAATPAAALRWAGVAVLAFMLLAAPLAFGAVESWAWGALWFLGAAAAALALVAGIVERRVAFILAPFLVLVLLLAAAALLQLLRLPPRIFEVAGARTAAVHEALAGSRPGRITLAPQGTVEAFFKITLVLTACFAALALVRTRAMAFTLVGASAAALLAASAVGIIQEKDRGEKIYGVRDLAVGAEERFWRSAAIDPALSCGVARVEAVDAGEGVVFFRRTVNVGDIFGPYANSNHFGGLGEIVLPVIFALLVALLATRRGGWGEEGGFSATAEGALVLLFAFVVLLGVGATVYAGSMGALGALAAGFAAVLLVMALGRQARLPTVAAFVLVGAGAVGAAFRLREGLSGQLWAKVAERAEVWRTTLGAVWDFPLLGSGLGTYRYVMPHYESTEMKYLFAHNDYLQLALEGGLVVAAAGALVVLWQMAVLVRGVFRRQEPYLSALCAGALGALGAVGFHSLFDFNMHVPANALTLGVLVCVGTVAAGARRRDIETVEFTERRVLTGRVKASAAAVVLVALVAAAGVFLAALLRAQAARGRARVFLARLDNSDDPTAPRKNTQLLNRVARALRGAPYDAELAYQASRLLWLEATSDEAAGDAAGLRSESLKHAAKAARLAPAYTFYAMTAVTMGAKGPGPLEKWPMAAFGYRRELAGMLFDQGRDEEGFAQIRQALALVVADSAFAPGRAMEAVADLVGRFGAYERIRSAAPDTFGGRVLFARGLAHAGLRSAAVEEYVKAAGLVEEGRGLEGFTERTAGEHAERLAGGGRPAEAERLYAAALEHRPGWQSLRLSYARFLAGRGKIEQARTEIDRILAADVPKWLSAGALDLRKNIQEK